MPESIRHKQLLELMQMLSCIVGFGYEKLPNGKAIKEWICKNKKWTYYYATYLFEDFIENTKNPKKETTIKYRCLLNLLKCQCENDEYKQPITAIFRYVSEYSNNTLYPTNSELPINVAVREYKNYAKWKGWK